MGRKACLHLKSSHKHCSKEKIQTGKGISPPPSPGKKAAQQCSHDDDKLLFHHDLNTIILLFIEQFSSDSLKQISVLVFLVQVCASLGEHTSV